MQKFTVEETLLELGYMHITPSIFHRKNWQGYMYLDRIPDYEGDDIFIKNQIPVHYHKNCFVDPTGQFEFCFCRVRKEKAELFEACLTQLHTILSHDPSYVGVLGRIRTTLS